MFYSHQLLSKRAPLGQIWMAATLHAKMNRRKVDSIDIIEICEQLLYPPVPLALRLSGILMEGVVIVFNRKVHFLYDDCQRFMAQVNDLVRAPTGRDQTLFPEGKSKARFEDVTINEGNDEVERLMRMQPSTPIANRFSMDFDYFIVPATAEDERPMFQAERENITLEEEFMPSFNHWDDQMHRFDEDRLPVDDTVLERTLFSEKFGDVQENELPEKERAADDTAEKDAEKEAPPVEEEPEVPAPKSPENDSRLRKPPRKRKTRKGKGVVIDEDEVVIPPAVYRLWLQSTSGIFTDRNAVGRRTALSCRRDVDDNVIEMLMYLPSAAFLEKVSANPHYPEPLLELWNDIIHSHSVKRRRRSYREIPDLNKDAQDNMFPHDENAQENMFPDNLPELNGAETGVEKEGSATIHRDASVERLRARLATPELEANWEFADMGLTPVPSSGRSHRSRLTPASMEGLEAVREDEIPELMTRDPKLKTPSTANASDFGDGIELGNTEGFVVAPDNITSLSPYELLVESGPSQPLNQTPKDCTVLDPTSIAVMTHLRQHFDTPGVPEKQSLFDLTEGMDRKQAAKLFYQTCGNALEPFLQKNLPTQPPFDFILIGKCESYECGLW